MLSQWPLRLTLTLAAVASFGAGCVGEIGDKPDPVVEPAVIKGEPLHRLNRLEYNNTVRDLLGVSVRPADSFPPDSATDGFDNLADGLVLTPSLLDQYASAARDLANVALDDAPRFARRVQARQLAEATGQEGTPFDWGWSLSRYGSKALAFGNFDTAQDETVTISVLAGGASVGSPAPEMGLVIDGVQVQLWPVVGTPTAPTVHTFVTTLPAGAHTITVSFPNGYDQPAENVYNTLVVGYVDVTSDTLVTPEGRGLVYVCDPTGADADGCYRTIVTRFAERAWRRPLATAEAEELTALFQSLRVNEGDDVAVKLVMRAVLLSSRFLYRASFEGAATPGGTKPLDDYTLASRLSYFIWSSMPDDALFEAAASGLLQTEEGLREQVQRMLADPKARALREGFASQWLSTRSLRTASPDPAFFPKFDEPLRAAMIEEAELFFEDFLRNGRPIGDMVNPDFGYLNDRLAEHYALPLPGSAELVRVPLAGDQRRGIATLGSWLTSMSMATRTSPVNRGRWVLENLLCTSVPPPPPDVPPFSETEEGATMRETLAAHRENPVCAGCHDLLDPAGLGLEEYDGIGAFRAIERGTWVDTTGALPPGEPFAGGRELAVLLQDDPRVPECVAEKLYVYAMGRKMVPDDRDFIEQIGIDLVNGDESLASLIELIVLSPAFRMGASEGGE